MVVLGVDFGTSSTVAVVGLDDGRAVPLLFGETPLLPSAVCVAAGGEMLVGRDAVRASRARPDAFEAYPKARIDDGEVLLGGRVVPVVETVMVWNVANPAAPTRLATLTDHQEVVWSVAFSPDGKTMATASADKTAKVWRVPAA